MSGGFYSSVDSGLSRFESHLPMGLRTSHVLALGSVGAAAAGRANPMLAPIMIPADHILTGTSAILSELGHGIPRKYVRKRRKPVKRKPKRRVKRKK